MRKKKKKLCAHETRETEIGSGRGGGGRRRSRESTSSVVPRKGVQRWFFFREYTQKQRQRRMKNILSHKAKNKDKKCLVNISSSYSSSRGEIGKFFFRISRTNARDEEFQGWATETFVRSVGKKSYFKDGSEGFHCLRSSGFANRAHTKPVSTLRSAIKRRILIKISNGPCSVCLGDRVGELSDVLERDNGFIGSRIEPDSLLAELSGRRSRHEIVLKALTAAIVSPTEPTLELKYNITSRVGARDRRSLVFVPRFSSPRARAAFGGGRGEGTQSLHSVLTVASK